MTKKKFKAGDIVYVYAGTEGDNGIVYQSLKEMLEDLARGEISDEETVLKVKIESAGCLSLNPVFVPDQEPRKE